MTASVIRPPVGGERQTFVAVELVNGTTPVAATWYELPNNGGAGVAEEIDTTESEELTPFLGTNDIIKVQTNGSFNYDFEMFRDDAVGSHTLFFESLLSNKFAGSVLTNGTDDSETLVIEDGIASTQNFIHVNSAYATAFSLSVSNGEIATGSWEGTGTPSLSPVTIVVGVADVTFTAPNSIDLGVGNLPATVVAGNYILVEGAADTSNNGYYKIASLGGADEVLVDGVIALSATDSPTMTFSGQTVIDGGATKTPNAKHPKMKAGDFITATIDGFDVLDFGLRFTNATINIARTREDLFEITVDKSFASAATEFTSTVEFEWHQINDDLIRRLENETEHALIIKLNSIDGRSIQFEFPRGKFSAGAFGSASKTAVLAGTSTYTALLNTSNEMVKITYAP